MKARLPRVYHLDASGEEAPELVHDCLDKLGPGEQLCMRIEREPFPLYRILSNDGYAYCTSALSDALYEVTIWRCGAHVAWRDCDTITTAPEVSVATGGR